MKSDRLRGVKTLKVSSFFDEFEKDEVKGKVDIVSLFSHFGVELTKKGKSHTGLCPFHDDKNPSLSVDRRKGLYNCFGCGESGDVFDLVQRMNGVGFTEALTFLKSYSGNGKMKKAARKEEGPAPLPEGKKTSESEEAPETEVLPKLEEPQELHESPGLSLNTIAEHYQKTLYKHPDTLNYLKSRGFSGYELYKRFGIGLSDGSLLSLVSERQKEALKGFGILNGKGVEHFTGYLTIPLFDETGQVVSFYGRAVDNKRKVKHLYLPGPHRGLVNRKATKVYREEIILTESVLDALSLIEMGIENVLPCYGVNGFTDEHLKALKDNRVKTVVLAFDADDAGRKGAEKLRENITEEGFPVKVVEPSSSKDWNEELVKGVSKESIHTLTDQAQVFKPEQEPTEAFSAKREGPKYLFTIAGVTYRLLGVKELFVSNLRVNIRAVRGEEKHLDNVDLYSARSRSSFAVSLSRLFDMEVKRIENDLIRILEYLEEEREKKLNVSEEKQIELSGEEKQLGLSFLTSKNIMREVTEDMTALGYVNEEINKQLVYLAGVSRLLPQPLNIYIQSGSSGGKSALLNTLEKLLPPEAVWKALTISTQAFHYVEESRFLNKVFIMGEDVHDEVIENLVRQMQSEGEVSRLVTLKDERTGELRARMISKKVTMSFMITSTSLNLHPENASRCLVLSVDESAAQTRKVQESMALRRSWEGEINNNSDTDSIIKKHRSAQRMLKKYKVYNPLARYIKFPKARPSMRRAYEQFLTLMDASCLNRQRQKEVLTRTNPKTGETVEAIECDLEDYKITYHLFVEGVLKLGGNDIPAGTKQLYEEIRKMLKSLSKEQNVGVCEVSFIRKQVREHTELGSEFIKKHLRFLVEYEYLAVTAGRRHGTRFSYRLRDDKPIEEMDVSVILTPEELKKAMEDEN